MKKIIYALVITMITMMSTATINTAFAETPPEPAPVPVPSPQLPAITYTTGEVTDLTDTLAVINGSCKVDHGDGFMCSMFAGYFYYWTDGGEEQKSELFYITGSSELEWTLTDLMPDTVYYYKFGDGYSSFGETKSFRTAKTGNENVHKVSALGDRVTVSFGGDYSTKISVPAGEIVTIRIETVPGDDIHISTNPKVTLNYVGSEHDTSYHPVYSVYSFVMPDEDVEIITATITPVIPPTITYTTGEVTDLTDTSAVLNGSYKIDDSGYDSAVAAFSGYFYYWTDGGLAQKSERYMLQGSSELSFSLTDLTPDTVYYCRFGDGEIKSFRTEKISPHIVKAYTEDDNTIVETFSMSGTFIIGASYDENGSLVNLKFLETDDNDKIILEGINADKIFIWDSINTMTPVCDVLEIK